MEIKKSIHAYQYIDAYVQLYIAIALQKKMAYIPDSKAVMERISLEHR
jgi:hypothetical protein